MSQRVRIVVAGALIALAGGMAGPSADAADDGEVRFMAKDKPAVPAPAGAAGETKPKIAQVFFAQHHVMSPTNSLFKLVGNLETLVKVHVDGPKGSPAPDVRARLALDSRTMELPLKGPALLPGPVTNPPALMEHRYEDSYTAIIPREWIAPGLGVAVELGAGKDGPIDRVVYDKVPVGAPTRLVMTMFDIHYFGGDKDGDYPEGWFEGLAARLPVAGLELQRVRNIRFETLVQLPRAGCPAIRCSSSEEYRQKAGIGYDGEQAMALLWNRALKDAAGVHGTRIVYYISIYGVPAGGEAGGFSGVGNGRRHGILLHELGHALGGLPDMLGKGVRNYPYVGPLSGIPAPEDQSDFPHVGPTWGFDPVTREFLPSVWAGRYRRDPMRGGGQNEAQSPGGMYRFFSDYNVDRIRVRLEDWHVRPDERTGVYMGWDPATGTYSRQAGRLGDPGLPVEANLKVVSILASASLVTPEANIVYPPIGPYTASRIASFDAASTQALAKARAAGYHEENSHVCLRVMQGGKWTTLLAKDGLDPKAEPAQPKSFACFAVNLPARDGEVSLVELLHTPGVLDKGVAPDCKVLARWDASTAPSNATRVVTRVYGEGQGKR